MVPRAVLVEANAAAAKEDLGLGGWGELGKYFQTT